MLASTNLASSSTLASGQTAALACDNVALAVPAAQPADPARIRGLGVACSSASANPPIVLDGCEGR